MFELEVVSIRRNRPKSSSKQSYRTFCDYQAGLRNKSGPAEQASIAVGYQPGFGQLRRRLLRGLWRIQHLGVGQLDQHVGLDVHGRADGERVQVSAPVGERQNGDGDGLAVEIGNGEADALDGYRAFVDHPGADVLRDADLEGPVGGPAVEVWAGLRDDRLERGHCARAVDVALDDVAAERAAGGGGQLEVDLGAG